jgi:hypothetical protein
MSTIVWQSILRENMIPDEMSPDQFIQMVQELNNSVARICQEYGVE